MQFYNLINSVCLFNIYIDCCTAFAGAQCTGGAEGACCTPSAEAYCTAGGTVEDCTACVEGYCTAYFEDYCIASGVGGCCT